MPDFKQIRNENRLLYEYIRGSHLYNLTTEDSDVDTGGIYAASIDELFGFGGEKGVRDYYAEKVPNLYMPQVSDERHDTTWFEIGKFMELLLKSNATVLETLFVPEDKMIVKPDKVLEPLSANRNEFVTKKCFKPFVEYAFKQIEKARGLNKKISNPIVERKGIMDFVYTFRNQGSTKIQYWLEYRHLNQKYCGLVNIPNMHEIYGVYYDWGKFFVEEGITFEMLEKAYHSAGKVSPTEVVEKLKNAKEKDDKVLIEFYDKILDSCYLSNMVQFIMDFYGLEDSVADLERWFNAQKPIGYSGMVRDRSQSLVLSSVSKGEKPICYASYNVYGYIKHCKDYKEYKEWEKFRNPKRYESNLSRNYDSKNMMHCARLMHMGIEIARGEGINLMRTYDHDFLMDVRNHKYEYDELMEIITKDKELLDDAIAKSTIKENIDPVFVNDMLIEIRKKLYF